MHEQRAMAPRSFSRYVFFLRLGYSAGPVVQFNLSTVFATDDLQTAQLLHWRPC